MTPKQLAERMGVDVKNLDIEPSAKCRACKKMGGGNEPECDWRCVITATITLCE